MALRYRLDASIESLHVLRRDLVAQSDRSLVQLSGTTQARRLTETLLSHVRQINNRGDTILSRGLLVPHQRLLVVRRVDSSPVLVHVAEHVLAVGVAPLGADLERRHRPLVVDRHALAPEVDATDALSSLDVALRGGCRTNE